MKIKRHVLFILLNLLLKSHVSSAFETNHRLKPNSNYDSSTLNNSCSTMKGYEFSYRCNSALFPLSEQEGIFVTIVGKSDGDSIENGRKLIFDPIDEALIRKLFTEKNYSSFTFNGDISFTNSLFAISYTPYYLLADLYLFNPAFPEISLNLASYESLRFTSGHKLNFDSSIVSFGYSVFYYEYTYENTVFSLFDLSFQKPEELIRFKTKYGVAADLGVYIESFSFLPRISFQLKNLNSKVKENETHTISAIHHSPLMLFETYSQVGIGKTFNTLYGGIDINLELPLLGYFEEIYAKGASIGLKYDLRLFSFLLGVSQYYQSLGLKFNSNHFNVGISYSREADLGKIQQSHENAIYTGIDISL